MVFGSTPKATSVHWSHVVREKTQLLAVCARLDVTCQTGSPGLETTICGLKRGERKGQIKRVVTLVML